MRRNKLFPGAGKASGLAAAMGLPEDTVFGKPDPAKKKALPGDGTAVATIKEILPVLSNPALEKVIEAVALQLALNGYETAEGKEEADRALQAFTAGMPKQ